VSAPSEFKEALDSHREIELTVVGRRSGRELTRPVWFVREGNSVYLIPIHGTDSDWFKNVVATPTVRLAAGGSAVEATAETITDRERVETAQDAFRAKYGERDFEANYPQPNSAVEVPLSR
jgi:deazaflavin-dependent oxidoreductase (nitroreductase family)